jgi:type IX secretion system PorP/SprF family membrane protein
MKSRVIKHAQILGLLLFAFAASAQDLHFSQFFEAPLLRNPSLAGIFAGDIRAQCVYRDQWNAFTNAYKTASLNVEYKMPVKKGNDFITLGLQFLGDRAGTVGLTTTSLMPAVNYHKSLSDEKTMYLSLGFMGGIVRKSFDASKMTTDNQYDGRFIPSRPTGENLASTNFLTIDGSVGMSFNTTFGIDQVNSLFVGAAFHHLNRPKNSFYRDASSEIDPKYVLSGGVKLRMDDFSYFTLQADQSFQGSFSETIGGALYSYQLGEDPSNPVYTISGGAFLRWKDALIPVLKIEKHPLAIEISYDVNVSQLKTASMGRGGFEVSISYIGYLDRYNSSRDKVLCPRF